MALRIVGKKSLPIGLDIGTSRLKLAQLRHVGQETQLLAAAAVPVPGEPGCVNLDRLADDLRGALRGTPFHGRSCVLSLPARETFVHHVRVPCLAPAETNNAVLAELRGKLPFPLPEAVVRTIRAGEVRDDNEMRQEMIAVAASRVALDRYVALAAAAKLEVVCVNIEACAIVECYARLFRRASDAGRTILFLDIGAASTQVVLSHGSSIVFARNLAIGGRQLDAAAAEGLKVPVEQAHSLRLDLQKSAGQGPGQDELYHYLGGPIEMLAGELTQCLRYYESVFRNQAVERVIFVGGQAHDKRLCQTLAQRLNLPAQVGDPLLRVQLVEGAGLSCGVDRRTPSPDWSVAIGLSLGAALAA